MCDNFLYFGCWNNINCEKPNEPLYRDIILEYIKDNENTKMPIFIAGDNWYATTFKDNVTGTNIKYYLKDILISGYYKVYEMENPKYIAVGNHDEEIDSEEQVELKKNCMINTQKYYINKIKQEIKDKQGSFKSSSNEKKSIFEESVVTLENVKYALDDINIFDGEKIGIIYNKKYIMIIINTNNFYSKTSDEKINSFKYLENIKVKIEEISFTVNQPIFVMGHVPLFTKKKSNNGGEIIKDIDYNIINDFYDILCDNECIYLCADTHNFSIMNIIKKDKSLIQITTGTGGANPDNIEPQNQDKYNEFSFNMNEFGEYKIKYFCINSFGYSVINVNSKKDISICYKNIITIDNVPGSFYTYNIYKCFIEYEKSLVQIENSEIVNYNIKNILSKVKDIDYKKNICSILTPGNIEDIKKMVVKNANVPDMKDVYCYQKKKKKKVLI